MADPHHTGPASESPLVQLMVSMSGASGAEHETEPPGASPTSLQAGHEPDRFAIRGILYVPVFVVVVVGLVYVLVTSLFAGMVHKADPKLAANKDGAEQNQARINDRFGRTSYTEPKALSGMPETAVPQPRLEGLRQMGNDGPGEDPPHIRSKRPLGTGNSPEYRPEDLRPANYRDPATGKAVLVEYGWTDDKKTAHVPIDVAMKAIAAPGKLPTKKGADGKPVVGPTPTTDARAKPSNAGRGAAPEPKAGEKH